MKKLFYFPPSDSLEERFWLIMGGPASLLDGLIQTVTLGCICSQFQMWTARKLALARGPEDE